jgi:hypothetical protein
MIAARGKTFPGSADRSRGAASERPPARAAEEFMDHSTFDRLARAISAMGTRRSVLRSLTIAGIAGVGLATLSDVSELEAKKGGHKRRKRRCRPTVPQAACQTNKECCTKKTKYRCGTSHGSGTNTCCGSPGAICKGGTLDCCTDSCCINGTCVLGPCP